MAVNPKTNALIIELMLLSEKWEKVGIAEVTSLLDQAAVQLQYLDTEIVQLQIIRHIPKIENAAEISSAKNIETPIDGINEVLLEPCPTVSGIRFRR